MSRQPAADRGASRCITLRDPAGATAEVHEYGAHVTSWRTPDRQEQLYLSARAAFDGQTAIRGGVPVIFPQFAGEGPLPKHGFARTTPWRPVAEPADDAGSAQLQLMDWPGSRASWPHEFAARVRVVVQDRTLRIGLSVANTGRDTLEFTAALHTYLRVGSIAETELVGLQGLRFRDSTDGGQVKTHPDVALGFEGEVNRIYLGAVTPVEVREPHRRRVVTMSGFEDVVVWNPGGAGEAALGDVQPGDSALFVCVEAAVVGTPVRLAPGERWAGEQAISAT